MRANKAEIKRRVYETLSVRLSGGQFHDLREWAQSHDWNVSNAQLWRYSQMADKLLAKRVEKNRDRLINMHVAKRELIYNRALASGHWGPALAAAKDIAELQRLYEPDDLAEQMQSLREEVRQLQERLRPER